MQYQTNEIKQGILLHEIKTKTFKTNLISVFLTIPLDRNTITKNSLIPAVLKRGTSKMQTQEGISKKLEEMYGASFDCGVEKMGDNQILKFYIECIDQKYIQESKDLIKENLNLLFEIILSPYLEQGCFKSEYVEGEKNTVRQLIESKVDDKNQYSLDRLIESMYQNFPYSLYKYGYVEDLEQITKEELYAQYRNVLKTAKIDIFVSGDFEETLLEKITENPQIKLLEARVPAYIVNNEETEKKEEVKEVQTVEEVKEVNQGKLFLGLDVLENKKDSRFAISIYNTILGNSANSKLFQNVREKEHLAYTTSSTYLRQKGNIYIKCGIDIENYEKALTIIKEQLEDMKNGKFSEEELENAKKFMISIIRSLEDEQDSVITYYLGLELSNYQMTLEEYEAQIQNVTKEQVLEIAGKVKLNTIYFLRN